MTPFLRILAVATALAGSPLTLLAQQTTAAGNSGGKAEYSPPTLSVVSATKTSVTIDVTAGATGMPNGFTIKWGTAANSLGCGRSLQANQNSQYFSIAAGASYRVTVGDPIFPAAGVSGASDPSGSCSGPLSCDLQYYFAAFAHGDSGTLKSDDSVVVSTKTAACNPPPIVTCPSDFLVCRDSGQSYATYTVPSVSVSGGTAPYTVTVSAVAGTSTLAAISSSPTVYLLPQGTMVFTVTATDSSGRTASCTYRAYVGSCEATCGAFDFCKLVVDAGLGPTSASFTGAGQTVNVTCTTPPFSSTSNNPLSLAPGSYPFSFAAKNPVSGRPDLTGTLTVTMIADTTAPVAPSLSQVTAECPAALPPPPKASDNCDGPNAITGVADKSGPFNVGSHTITWTFRDSAGNTTTQTQTLVVQDKIAPVPTKAGATLEAALGQCSVEVTAPTATDACVGALTATGSYVPTDLNFTATGTSTAMTLSGGKYTFSAQGYYLVTWTFSDGNGNTSTQTQQVAVKDTTAPVITCPANITQNTDAGKCDAVVAFAATATDNCAVSSLTYAIKGTTTAVVSGATFPKGTTTVVATAVDAAGNTSTCEFTVTVVDNQAPVITCPANITQNTDAGKCDAVVAFAATATDNCAVSSLTYAIKGTTTAVVSGATFPKGTTTVVATAVDAAGNTSTCEFTVTVVDNQAPVITCPANITQNTDAGKCDAVVAFAATATDNCAVSSLTYAIKGTTTAVVSGATFPKGTTTVVATAVDATGNTSTCEFTVTVVDNQAPVPDVANLPDVTGQCSATVTAPVATDNCTGKVTGTTSNPLTYTQQGTYTVTWTFDDGNGNTSTQTQKVIVRDNTAPVAPTLSAVSGQCSVEVSAPSTTDNCAGTVTANAATYVTTDANFAATGTSTAMTLSGGKYTFSAQGYYLVTWTFSDGNGNTQTAEQRVTVKDNQAPVPDVASLPDVTGQCSATVTAPTATDACAGKVMGTTSNPLTYAQQGTYTVTWTFDDGNGNTSTQTQKVIVKDTTAPVPDVANLPDVTGQCSATVTAPTATDACAGKVTGTTSNPLTYTQQGTYTVTWTFSDGNGNTSTQTQKVIVKDTTAPDVVLTVTAGSQTDACSGELTITASATDSCTSVASLVVKVDGSVIVLAGGTTKVSLPAGSHTVLAEATDGAGNVGTRSQTVSVAGSGFQVTGKVYKDTNLNGSLDATDTGVGGVSVTVSGGAFSQSVTTAADGTYAVSVPSAGSYTVSVRSQSGWMNVSSASVPVALSALNCSGKADFGQVRLGAGGGLTLGFWSNKNGQSLETPTMLSGLSAQYLRNAAGADFDPASASSLSTWLTNANATNMANMLSAQLAAMWLNVNVKDPSLKSKFGGSVNPDAYIYAPGTLSANSLGFAKVGAILAEANLSLGANPVTISLTAARIYQEALKNALDNANNNRNFVQ